MMEKHALNKVLDHFKEKKTPRLPCLRIVGTFKDEVNLYFLTEMLKEKTELWQFCRTFGLLSDMRSRFTFMKICEAVKYMHDLAVCESTHGK